MPCCVVMCCAVSSPPLPRATHPPHPAARRCVHPSGRWAACHQRDPVRGRQRHLQLRLHPAHFGSLEGRVRGDHELVQCVRLLGSLALLLATDEGERVGQHLLRAGVPCTGEAAHVLCLSFFRSTLTRSFPRSRVLFMLWCVACVRGVSCCVLFHSHRQFEWSGWCSNSAS